MKSLLLSLSFFFVIASTFSQSCPPDDLTLTTQNQVDSFQINYPGCVEIENMLELDGIGITNLNGLNVLESIGRHLIIRNTSLESLAGLENLEQIWLSLIIQDNPVLSSLEGLDNLDFVGENLFIYNNNTLNNLNGLGLLVMIWNDVTIKYCSQLTDISGLMNVTSIGGTLLIQGNNDLTSLSGLDNLITVGGGVEIKFNESLEDISSLSNLESIEGNLLLYNDNSLIDLSGLDQLTTVSGDLQIYNCDNLLNLNGLSSLSNVRGNFLLNDNDALVGLNGLLNLDSIGGNLEISLSANLMTVEGINNLSSIGGALKVKENPILKTLAGLDNINANSIEFLQIGLNGSLAMCHVQSICDYLARPDAVVQITANDNGCNTREQVETRCETLGITDVENVQEITCFPNPAQNKITFQVRSTTDAGVTLRIYDNSGRLLEVLIDNQYFAGYRQVTLDLDKYSTGLYYYQLTCSDGRLNTFGKFIRD